VSERRSNEGPNDFIEAGPDVAEVRAQAGPVLLICHSTRPRGGLIHTLSLGEALLADGVDVRLVALGDPAAGLFRPTALPHTVVAAPPPADTLEERVFQAVDALEAGLAHLLPPGPAVLHAQDCIAARAAARIRDGHALTGPRPQTIVVRTVHHVDDFTTRALIECQQRAIVDPDRVLVVSEHWRERLAGEYGVLATVVRNGVDPDRFGAGGPGEREVFRARAGAGADTFLILTVGGIEPRKGSVTLLEAVAGLKRAVESNGGGPRPVLAVVGGHTFFDYRAYRDSALARLPELGLAEGRDVLLLGTVSEADLGGWYRAADAFAFPSVKEGFGLVVLEALAAGLPVVASDIPVFAEYLEDGRNALLVAPGDAGALAGGLGRLAADPELRRRLAAGGAPLLDRFTWAASAASHRKIYAEAEVSGVGGRR
jgi:glycosyltransferase-like protein